MDKKNTELVRIMYDGQEIEVTPEVAEVLAETEKMFESQKRKDRRYISSIQSMDGNIEDLAFLQTSGFEDVCISAANMFQIFSQAKFTAKQKRRFWMHFAESLTYREIAEKEGVTFRAVYESIQYAIKKLKKFFKNTHQNRP